MRLSQGYQTDCNQSFKEIGIEISDKNYILPYWTILNNEKDSWKTFRIIRAILGHINQDFH